MRYALCGPLVAAIALATASSALAQSGQQSRQVLDGAERAYSCATPDRDIATPPPQPELPLTAERIVARQKPLLTANPDCPVGTVVAPKVMAARKGSPVLAQGSEAASGATGVTGPKGAVTRGGTGGRATARRARPRAVFQYGYWYWYAIGSQGLAWQQGTNGLWAYQSNEKPYIQYTNAQEHSISQLWGIDQTPGGAGSTQELGWIVDFRMFNDLEPHLFVYHFDGGAPTGYGAGFVSETNVVGPGSVLTHNDNLHIYGIQRYGTDWWFYYDGIWLGRLPQSAYTRYWNAGFTRIDAGGELASSNPNTCGDMGSYGPIPGGAYNAAMWQQVWRQRGDTGNTEYAAFAPYAPDPAQYSLGFFTGSSFRYGGGGYC